MSTHYGTSNGVSLSRYAGPADGAVVHAGELTRARYQIDISDSGMITLDPNQLHGLRVLLDRAAGRDSGDPVDRDPLADYRPVHLTDGGLTDEAALLDRILFVVVKIAGALLPILEDR